MIGMLELLDKAKKSAVSSSSGYLFVIWCINLVLKDKCTSFWIKWIYEHPANSCPEDGGDLLQSAISQSAYRFPD